jgi:putative oxidoreductase
VKTPFVIGRMMFGGFFIYNGINHFVHTRELAHYAGAKHVPEPDLAVRAAGVAMLIGGTSVLLGLKPKVGAAAIIGFLATVSPTIHSFWADEDPGARQADMINFGKNLALLGAALALVGVEEPWPASLSRKKTVAQQVKKIAWKVLAA